MHDGPEAKLKTFFPSLTSCLYEKSNYGASKTISVDAEAVIVYAIGFTTTFYDFSSS